ncbi:MAG: CinA family protein [Chloroflexi bacterium]|nr:CinA family protein [Chloroflexota bacterium]MDA1145843.1 CinA family protein [Chloroflexota bacterium]
MASLSAPDFEELQAQAASVVARMTARGLRLATAESTVGGLIGFTLTSVPGASKAFIGGITAYGGGSKTSLLHVPEATLREHGSVAAPTVAAMARGAREAFGVDLAVAESGIASPTQNSERPGGLYYIGLIAEDFERVERHEFAGDRVATMQQATAAALSLIDAYLDESERRAG